MGWLKTGIGSVVGAVVGLAALNTWLGWRVGPLGSALVGESRYYHWLTGTEVYNVFYRVTGTGAPVVLVHGIDAAASSFELRQVFAGLADSHRVYALDLLGFGLSDRPARRYTAADYVELIEAFLRDVVQAPAAIIASSLSAAYAVAVAARAPERVARLVLVCPTGLEHLADPPPAWQHRLGDLLRLPVIGSALFNLLVARPSLRWFLTERTYADPARVTPELLDHYYLTAHQGGARHAPAAFVGGSLNLSIRETYPTLGQPVLVVWGREAQITPVSDANQFIRSRPTTRLKVLDRCGLLPHDERPEEFLAIAREALGHVS